MTRSARWPEWLASLFAGAAENLAGAWRCRSPLLSLGLPSDLRESPAPGRGACPCALAATAASRAQVASAAADGARAWWQFLDERQTAA